MAVGGRPVARTPPCYVRRVPSSVERSRDAPIFVIGFQRSGTTLLQALLGAHPRIAAPPELYFVGRVADHVDYFGDLSDDRGLERALHETLHPPLDLLAECGFDDERLLAAAKRAPRTYAGLLDTVLTDFAERNGKRRWAEKSAGQPLPAVMNLFPDALAIHIVRDPRDVVASSREMPWSRHESAAALARGWRAFTMETARRGLELGPAQFMQVRYEDLTRDPDAVMRLVCAFIGEDYDPAMVSDSSRRRATVPALAAGWQGRALGNVEPVRTEAWRERLDRVEQLGVHAIVGPLLAPLGYSPPPLRDLALSVPFRLEDFLRRGRERLRRRPPALGPEERYRLKRSYLEAQARRVHATGA